ncbi:hypothetical protein QYM36_004480, partial [Artemia franciscana]
MDRLELLKGYTGFDIIDLKSNKGVDLDGFIVRDTCLHLIYYNDRMIPTIGPITTMQKNQVRVRNLKLKANTRGSIWWSREFGYCAVDIVVEECIYIVQDLVTKD